MRFNNIKRVSQDNAKRVYYSVKLINRHALILVPLLGLTFAIIAGWVATEYGTHFLFRDNEPLDYFGLCDHNIPCLLKSARFHTALYATALMGMVWTLFVLIERRDEDITDRHPVGELEPVLPGVVLLGLVMVVAALLNKDDPERTGAVVALSGLGFLTGLLVVAVVTKLGLWLSQRIRCHQVWTFLGLSIGVALAVSALPLVTPSKAIFIALAAAVVLYCAFEIAKAHYRFPLAALIVVVLLIGSGLPKFKYEFEGLEHYYQQYKRPKSASPATAGTTGASLLERRQTLDAWLSQQGRSKPKLVVVAASGGAYRAAFWTAVVLDCLSANPKLPGFDRAIRLMTGASGGMVGAAYFAASRQPGAGASGQTSRRCAGKKPLSGIPWIEDHPRMSVEGRLRGDLMARGKNIWLANSQTDSLTPVVQRLIGTDLRNAFWPMVNREDRGKALEEEWLTLQLTFCDLEAGEREGWRPSLIISPYLVDWALPMFISNLNLKEIIKPDFAVEFFRHFPEAHDEFKLATAVRMNATFPFISPTVRLPLGRKRPRVVDAGYFDNFGIAAAATFLRDDTVRDFIKNETSGVILIRILAYEDRRGPTEPDDGGSLWDEIGLLFEQLTSPLEGALAARETRGRFANELLLEDLRRMYAEHFHDFRFINPTSASFSWHIQNKELDDMRNGMSKHHNEKELEQLVKVWAGRPPS